VQGPEFKPQYHLKQNKNKTNTKKEIETELGCKLRAIVTPWNAYGPRLYPNTIKPKTNNNTTNQPKKKKIVESID
jgi:hypothetical protein